MGLREYTPIRTSSMVAIGCYIFGNLGFWPRLVRSLLFLAAIVFWLLTFLYDFLDWWERR